jgi:hypothetical protein
MEDTYYRLISIRPGHTLVIPALTIELTGDNARVQTTLGETVSVSRVDFIRLVRWILRENDADNRPILPAAA